MAERVPESNYRQLQHFISESEWDAKAVMRDVARNTNQSLGSVDISSEPDNGAGKIYKT